MTNQSLGTCIELDQQSIPKSFQIRNPSPHVSKLIWSSFIQSYPLIIIIHYTDTPHPKLTDIVHLIILHWSRSSTVSSTSTLSRISSATPHHQVLWFISDNDRRSVSVSSNVNKCIRTWSLLMMYLSFSISSHWWWIVNSMLIKDAQFGNIEDQ